MFEKATEVISRKLVRVHDLTKMAIGLGIGLVMLVIFTVIAFGVFYGANTSTWGSDVTGIWKYIPLIVVAVIIAVIAGYALHASKE